jgi:hypothetical protein
VEELAGDGSGTMELALVIVGTVEEDAARDSDGCERLSGASLAFVAEEDNKDDRVGETVSEV